MTVSEVMFTLVRHAESEANVSTADVICGHSLGINLTPAGEEQANLLGKYFLSNDYQFTAAFSSTAQRTQRTAQLCFKAMGRELSLVVDERLLEQSPGGWEGKSRDIYKRPDVRLALDTDNWSYVPGDETPGESQQMVAERMVNWIKEKVDELSVVQRKHHLVVFTHSLAIKYLLTELLNLDRPTAYSNVNPVDNASITQLCYRNRKLVLPLAKRNYVQHLAEA